MSLACPCRGQTDSFASAFSVSRRTIRDEGFAVVIRCSPQRGPLLRSTSSYSDVDRQPSYSLAGCPLCHCLTISGTILQVTDEHQCTQSSHLHTILRETQRNCRTVLRMSQHYGLLVSNLERVYRVRARGGDLVDNIPLDGASPPLCRRAQDYEGSSLAPCLCDCCALLLDCLSIVMSRCMRASRTCQPAQKQNGCGSSIFFIVFSSH